MSCHREVPTLPGKHRGTRPTDSTPTDATCNAESGQGGHVYCPRHSPADYADMMARHATDSIGPLQTAAERYHSSNTFGR